MATDKTGSQINPRAQRSFKYGLNVLVSIVAAVGIAVLVNWIGHRRFIRFDQTASRQYSLSQQTLNVLDQLEGEYRIVTLFSGEGPYIEQAYDLAEEYGRYGDRLSVERLIPTRDVARLERFLQTLIGRYEKALEPIRGSIEDAQRALKEIRGALPAMMQAMRTLMEDPTLGDGELRQFLQSVAQAMARLESEINEISTQIDKSLGGPLPQYKHAKQTLTGVFLDLDEKLFSIARRRFEEAVDDDSISASIKEGLLQLLGVIKPIGEQLRAARLEIDAAATADEYEAIADQLSMPDTVVVVGPSQVRVLALTALFREPDPRQLQPGEQPDLRFQGEEKLTGALVSMSLEHPPMVVFVTGGQSAVIGPRGPYGAVAERLRSLNFRVEEWSPVGQPSTMGQMAPPRPAPKAEQGQRAVWVVLPVPPPDPMNPLMAGANQKVADQMNRALTNGQSVMVMVSASTMPSFAADPIVDGLGKWGMTPQLDRILLREVVRPNNTRGPVSQLDIEPDSWPTDTEVSGAVRGMAGLFLQASPIVLGQKDTDGIELWPLVTIQGEDIWSERDFQGPEPPELDPTTAGERYVIAAAAQKQGARMIVVADPAWATNQVLTYGMLGPGTAEIVGAAFPGNSELFVNSINWLGHLDQLIAASARTQDIRRIGAISRSGLTALRWSLLVGMPLAVFAIGVGVWFIRRAG